MIRAASRSARSPGKARRACSGSTQQGSAPSRSIGMPAALPVNHAHPGAPGVEVRVITLIKHVECVDELTQLAPLTPIEVEGNSRTLARGDRPEAGGGEAHEAGRELGDLTGG